ncbi:MAG: ECF transporter S component [Clostridiales bacterium]|nr:ECF transporter S component [Clostridiales bacterium]
MSKKKSMPDKKLLVAVELSLLSAIIIVMTFVPYIGYISYGALSITLLHIPVIVGGVMLGVKGGTFLGGVWGVTCLIKAVFLPPTPLEGIIFRNPLISVVPRILVGLVAGLMCSVFNKFAHKGLAAGIAAVIATVTNTVLVLGGIYLIYGKSYGADLGIATVNFGGLFKYIMAAFTINAVLEIVAAVVISVPVSLALKRAKVE